MDPTVIMYTIHIVNYYFIYIQTIDSIVVIHSQRHNFNYTKVKSISPFLFKIQYLDFFVSIKFYFYLYL